MSSSHAAPPTELVGDLDIDPADWRPRDVYHLLTGLVVPRPIAWVSTYGSDGVRNLAPHSYFNVVAHRPPHVVFAWAGLDAEPAAVVDAPRVVRAPAHLECRLVEEVAAGNGTIVIGEVVHLHVTSAIWRDGRVDPTLLAPVARLAGSGYAGLAEVVHLERPTWRGLSGT